MASCWIHGAKGNYQILMSDGYLHPRTTTARQAARRAVPLEQIVAERLYHEGKRSDRILDPLHVWIVGSPAWMSRTNRLALALAEGDRSPEYRVAIIGTGRCDESPKIFTRWTRALARVGWFPKPHPEPMPYVLVGGLVMQDLVEPYLRSGAPTTGTFSEFGLPVAFCGDDY